LPDGSFFSEDLQLVHHPTAHNKRDADGGLKSSCQYDENQTYSARQMTVPGHHLGHFLGVNGLSELLALPRTQKLPWEEAAEMIRRTLRQASVTVKALKWAA